MPQVLIVDDHATNRYLLRCILEADGYEVIEATHGQEALELAQTHTFVLVVSDILMPVLDGFSLCRAWRADPKLEPIPFVFYTATYIDPRDEAFARDIGADDFITKPTEPIEFRNRIRKVIQKANEPHPAATPFVAGNETPYLKQYNAVLIRKLEDKLVEVEAANQTLLIKDFALTSSANGILLADLNGVVTYANPAVANWFGVSHNDLLGKSVSELLHPPAAWANWLHGSDDGYRFDARILRDTTPRRTTCLSVTAHFILSDERKRLGIMLSCVDTTEERRLREELARAQRLEALSLFSAGVAHDFNNLLVAMFAGLEFATAPDLSPEERQEYRATGLAALQRAKELTLRLLSFSRGHVGKKQAVDLLQVLRETLLISFSGSGVRYLTRFDVERAMVDGNPGQLAQVFSNLFVNARQAMTETGTLLVSVERHASRNTWTVRVTDDGPGIPDTILPKIFEPYFTTKVDGTGLGLATCHTIIHDHGGRIDVSSEAGSGATFEVTLPISVEPMNRAPATIPGDADVSGTGRILIMDELVINQALIQRSLERVGYSVVSVGNGEQVLLEFDRAKQTGVPFDLVILDETVRGALGGLETLLTLRRQGYVVPVIASTGYSDEQSLSNLLKNGFDGVLGKPFFIHELLSTVKAVLGDTPESERNPPTIRSGEI
jgi:PAS domain S-box-containing protein